MLAAALLLPTVVPAQGVGDDKAGRIEGRYKIVPLPYVGYNRSIDLSVGALPMVMFNPVERDTISPSSVAGLLGMYATNGTWFGMGFTKMSFSEDRWRFTAAGGVGSIDFQFYLDNPVAIWVPYNTRADFAYLGVQRQIIENVYGGVTVCMQGSGRPPR